MKYEDLIKKRNKMLIIYIILSFSWLIPFIPGVILVDIDENDVLGTILIILAIFIFIVANIWLVIISVKLNKQINLAKVKYDKELINRKKGIRLFKTNTNDEIEFGKDNFIINGTCYKYESWNFTASFQYTKLGLIPSIVITGYNEVKILELNGDLLDAIESCNIPLVNKKELDYYLDNIEECNKLALKKVVSPRIKIIPMVFVNSEFSKNYPNVTKNKIVFSLFSIIVIIGIGILLMWMSVSESGNNFSNLIRLDIIVKVVVCTIIILLAFIKADKLKWHDKLALLSYVVCYASSIIWFTQRISVIIHMTFCIIFVILGLLKCNGKNLDKFKNVYFNRLFGMAVFLFYVFFLNITDYTFINEGKAWLVSLFVMLGLNVIVGITLVLYFRKPKVKNESKKNKILTVVGTLSCTIFFGYLVCVGYVFNINYAFDISKPVVKDYEIIDLEKGEDSESDTAIVIINDKEISISITSDDYYSFKVGDYIRVSLYEGALNMPYYIYE